MTLGKVRYRKGFDGKPEPIVYGGGSGMSQSDLRLVAAGMSQYTFIHAAEQIWRKHFAGGKAGSHVSYPASASRGYLAITGNDREVKDALANPGKMVVYWQDEPDPDVDRRFVSRKVYRPKLHGVFDIDGEKVA